MTIVIGAPLLNLNDTKIPSVEGPDESLQDWSLTSGACTVYFRMLAVFWRSGIGGGR